MNAELLTEAIGLVDDRYLIESEKFCQINARRKHVWRNIAASIVVVPFLIIVLLMASVPVFAATGNEFAYDILYAISPSVAQAMKPVNESCISNGIQIEVLSADIGKGEAWVYLAVRDLEDSRIDASTDLFDSYSIRIPVSYCSASCRGIFYDENKNEKTYLVYLWWDESEWSPHGEKVTFQVKELLSGQIELLDYELNIPLSEIDPSPKEKNIYKTGAGGDSDPDNTNAVVMDVEGTLYHPLPSVWITGVGIIDNEIHIQLKYENNLENDAHARFPIYSYRRSVYWMNDDHSVTYQEVVLSNEIISDDGIRISADFWEYGQHTEGNWEVTFRIENNQ